MKSNRGVWEVVVSSGRQSGRTTAAIRLVYERGGVLLVASNEQKHLVQEMSQKMGLDISVRTLGEIQYAYGEHRPLIADHNLMERALFTALDDAEELQLTVDRMLVSEKRTNQDIESLIRDVRIQNDKIVSFHDERIQLIGDIENHKQRIADLEVALKESHGRERTLQQTIEEQRKKLDKVNELFSELLFDIVPKIRRKLKG